MKMPVRLVAAAVALSFALVGCGGGGGKSSLVGGLPSGSGSGSQSSGHNVSFTLSIPAGGAGTTSTARRTPQSVSASTQSIAVTVNGGTPQTFNAASPTCTGTNPLTCTISVGAGIGLDSFLIVTYSGANGTGTALNAAIVTLNVTAGGPNSASATAGNIMTVNDSANGSGGSFSCTSGSTTCTLPEAVAEANAAYAATPGTTTAILFSGVSSIALSSTLEVSTNLVIIGPGASVANPPAVGAPAASGNLTINGGGGQAFFIGSGAVTFSGLTIAGGGGASTNGAAIQNYGTLSAFNMIFSNNSDGEDGGAIYDGGAAATTIVASTFSNNTAIYGGAMFGANNSPTTIVATTFSGNTSNNDGAYGGAFYMNNGNVSFINDTFTGNTSYEPSDGYANGGAIYDASSGALVVTSSTFTNNVAGNPASSFSGGNTGYGGAISIEGDDGPSVTITNSTFSNNYAGGPGMNSVDTGFGGAIYNDSCNPLTLSGNTFNGNKAQGAFFAFGGAIDDSCGALAGGTGGSPDTFTANIADASPCITVGDCVGYAAGGAVYLEDVASFTGETFSGNQVLGGGESDGGAITSDGANLTATNVTFSANSSTDPDFATGGALVAYDQTVTLTNVQFSKNAATGNGPSSNYPEAYGGGMAGDQISLAFSGVTFTSNSATTPQGGGTVLGGGLEEYDGDEGGCDDDCSKGHKPAPQSAAFSRVGTTSIAFSGGKHKIAAGKTWDDKAAAVQKAMAQFVTKQQAASARHVSPSSARGAKAASRNVMATRRPQQAGSSSALANVTFTGNTANGGPGGEAFGGGADLSGTPTVTGAAFSTNTATASGSEAFATGGGLSYSYSRCEEMSFTGTIIGNSTLDEGGGLSISDCDATVSQSTINSNLVTNAQYVGDGGGGIFNLGFLILTQSVVASNSVSPAFAQSGGGGMLSEDFFGESLTEIVNSTIADNTSATDGGGVLDGGTNGSGALALLQNVTIYQNTATTGKGGNAIEYANSGANLVLFQNTIFAGGSAPGDTDTNDAWNGDTVVSLNYNLVGQSSSTSTGTSICGVTGNPGHCANDLQNVSPQLASGFGNNGGPTSTIADTSGSPGAAYIPFAAGACGSTSYEETTFSGPAVDQRGYARGSGGKCDVGAFELNGTAP